MLSVVSSRPITTIINVFSSPKLAVEAKTELGFVATYSLFGIYRLLRSRSDASIYGVASGGYAFIFVTITHDRKLQRSKRFNVEAGDIKMILGCLRYVLKKSASMSPYVTLEKKDEHQSDIDSRDPVVDLDNQKSAARSRG
jgi:hypothetical protein